MELAIDTRGPHPWKAALLALLFILLLGFGTAWLAHRPQAPVAGAMCRCPHTNPAQRCFCPPLGNSCQCEK